MLHGVRCEHKAPFTRSHPARPARPARSAQSVRSAHPARRSLLSRPSHRSRGIVPLAWLLPALLGFALLGPRDTLAQVESPSSQTSRPAQPNEASQSSQANKPAQPNEPSERAALLADLAHQLQAGDLPAARGTAESYLARYPHHGLVEYNLACITAQLGDTVAAWQALDEAFADGFNEVRTAAGDPDLAPLRADPRFAALLARCRDRLDRRARESALRLTAGSWSEKQSLNPAGGLPRDESTPVVDVQIRQTAAGLDVLAHITARRFLDRFEPWVHGDGMLVHVVVPPDTLGYEGRRYFSFGFGLEGRLPVGAVLSRHGEPVQRRVMELAPKIRLMPDGKTATYQIHIPWTIVAPYAPPLDSLLGLNVVYHSIGEDGLQRLLALVEDPQAGDPTAARHRFVPLTLQPGPDSPPVLQGRVSNAVVGREPLQVELVAWCPQAAHGTLELEVRDVFGRSVVSGGPGSWPVDLSGGIDRWQQPIDLAALPVGPFRLEAMLRVPGDSTLTWSTDLLRYEADWPDQARGRLQAVPPLERASVSYRLDAITEALAGRAPRDDPSPISTTLVEAGQLLQRAETQGTVLPDSGSFAAAVERPGGGAPLPCSLWLPENWAAGRPLQLVLVLAPRPERDMWLAAWSGRLTGRSDLAVLVPRLDPAADGEQAALTTAAAVLAWARARFGESPVWLAGLDEDAATALEFSLRHPELCAGVLLLAGSHFAPWSGEQATATLTGRLRRSPNELPYTLYRSQLQAQIGAAAALAEAMKATGFHLVADEKLEGGLSVSEVPGLVARWLLPASGDGTARGEPQG